MKPGPVFRSHGFAYSMAFPLSGRHRKGGDGPVPGGRSAAPSTEVVERQHEGEFGGFGASPLAVATPDRELAVSQDQHPTTPYNAVG